jgi:hypothetical protein
MTFTAHLQVWSLNPRPLCYQTRAIPLTHHCTKKRKETISHPIRKTCLGCTSTYSKPLANKPKLFFGVATKHYKCRVPRQKSSSPSRNLTFPGHKKVILPPVYGLLPHGYRIYSKTPWSQTHGAENILMAWGQLVGGGLENILNTCSFKISGSCIEFQALFVSQKYSFLREIKRPIRYLPSKKYSHTL